jgi:membrane protease YdiL (CAAX protease family)
LHDLRSRRLALIEALVVSAGVTGVVAAIAAGLPDRWHTTLVGFVFLGVTWAMVWRKDDDAVRQAGLALGGLVIPGPQGAREVALAAGRAALWGLAFGAVVAVPFYFGWRAWWGHFAPQMTFALAVRPGELANDVAGQIFVIALPEEAFYRGYLQSRLDEVWPRQWNIAGAQVGPGLLVGASIFALGHLATVHLPARLAVFFPALVFGWLRARTGGVGACIFFHAFCNVYSQLLGRGYGLY